MSVRRVLAELLVFTCFSVSTPEHLSAASFQGLGRLFGGSAASDVSSDGTVVVGNMSIPGHQQPFRWDAEHGMVLLDLLSPTSNFTTARSVSADGSTVVGYGEDANGRQLALLWEGASAPIALDELATSSASSSGSRALDISIDGTVVVGQSLEHAFRWDAVNGTVGLGGPPGIASRASWATSVNFDGSVIVGGVTTDVGMQPFRWDAEQGMIGLGPQPNGIFGGQALGVSADGSVIVGVSWQPFLSPPPFRAFRWDAENGMVELGEPPAGYQASAAYNVSADGRIVVGTIGVNDIFEYFTQRAVYWDEEGRIYDLEIMLSTMGLDVSGWTLISAQGVSADGQTIVGSGINPDGRVEAWIAVIPEPSTALLVGIGLVGMAHYGKRWAKTI